MGGNGNTEGYPLGGGSFDVKMGRCIKELERIYGIKAGRPSKESSANGTIITEKDLANQLGFSVDTLKRAKKLADLPKEIQDMVESGKITASTLCKCLHTLSEPQRAF